CDESPGMRRHLDLFADNQQSTTNQATINQPTFLIGGERAIMLMKKFAQYTAIIALSGMASVAMAGTKVNGISVNGISVNGTSVNGISVNGVSLNGISLNGTKVN